MATGYSGAVSDLGVFGAGGVMFNYVTLSDAADTYPDTSVAPGVSYTYSVTAEFTDGDTKAVDLSDTRYAMDATELQVYSSPYDGTVPYDAAGDAVWFNFLGQKGWVYRVTVTGNTAVDIFR